MEQQVGFYTDILKMAVMLMEDLDDGSPVVAVRFIRVRNDEEEPAQIYKLTPGKAQELGVTLVGAAATASLFESAGQYVAAMRAAGKEVEAVAVEGFADWMGSASA